MRNCHFALAVALRFITPIAALVGELWQRLTIATLDLLMNVKGLKIVDGDLYCAYDQHSTSIRARKTCIVPGHPEYSTTPGSDSDEA